MTMSSIPTNEQIGANMRILRTGKGIGLREMARTVNCDPATLSRWERGIGNPDFQTVARVAEALGESLDDLIGNTYTTCNHCNGRGYVKGRYKGQS